MEFGRFPEMIELGVTVALGSDAAMSSNYLDIVREMFLASGGCKAQRLDPSIMPPETVLEMATLNGAKAALWSDEIGSLEAGKKADIAIFDTRKPEWQPVLNPLANLVYSARGGADTVICNGRILLENDVVLSIDEKRALAEAEATRRAHCDRFRPLGFDQTEMADFLRWSKTSREFAESRYQVSKESPMSTVTHKLNALVLATVATTLFGGLVRAEPGVTDNEIRIGMWTPLSGPVALLGQSARDACAIVGRRRSTTRAVSTDGRSISSPMTTPARRKRRRPQSAD